MDIELVLEMLNGDPVAVSAVTENFITAYFGGNDAEVKGIGIGEDLIRDRLASPIINLPGLKRIRRINPNEDIVVSARDMAMLQSLKVTTEWVSER